MSSLICSYCGKEIKAEDAMTRDLAVSCKDCNFKIPDTYKPQELMRSLMILAKYNYDFQLMNIGGSNLHLKLIDKVSGLINEFDCDYNIRNQVMLLEVDIERFLNTIMSKVKY